MPNLTITNEVEYEYAVKLLETYASYGYSSPISDKLLKVADEYELLNKDVAELEKITSDPVGLKDSLLRMLKDQNPSKSYDEILSNTRDILEK